MTSRSLDILAFSTLIRKTFPGTSLIFDVKRQRLPTICQAFELKNTFSYTHRKVPVIGWLKIGLLNNIISVNKDLA